VVEGSRFVSAPIALTGTVYSQTSVRAVLADGTATLDDYVGGSTFALWNRFEPGERELVFEAIDDGEIESDESFYVDLSPSNDGLYVLGARTRLEIVILDDDGGIRPYFELTAPFRASALGELIWVADQGEVVDLPVHLTAPAPAGYSVEYQIDGGAPLTLAFAEGSTMAALSVPAAAEAVPGADYGLRRIHLVDPSSPQKIEGGSQDGAGAYPVSIGTLSYCFLCGFFETFCVVDAYQDCDYTCPPSKTAPVTKAGPGNVISVLRAYRDDVLAATEAGRFYIRLYDSLSPALLRATFRDPDLFFGLPNLGGEWIDAFDALSTGNGASVVVTPSMQANLTELLDRLEAVGDPELVQAIQRERTRLMLDAVVDLTMDELQNRVETLGGVRTESGSWGRLKSRYHD
jgi:hypothetical protein